jgi:hypothetical protein
MAAIDMFETFLNQISNDDKEKVSSFIRNQRVEMFAARSEDARQRIAHEFMKEVKALLRKK